MQIPEQVRAAVKARVDEAAVTEQARRRWCEAVAYGRNHRRRHMRSERDQMQLDIQAVAIARSGVYTAPQAAAKADIACRFNEPRDCALWLKVYTKLTISGGTH